MATNTDPKSPSYSVPFTIGNYHLRILSATKADVEEFAEVFWDAFQDDILFKAMNGTADLQKLHAHTVKSWADIWDAVGNAWFKIVDEDQGNKIAAIAKWGFPHQPLANAAPPPSHESVEGENMEVKKAFFEGLFANREKNWKKEDMYLMNILAVRHSYQRLGLGRQLLAPVLKLADEEGRRCYIEASTAGKTLYEKFGWKRIDDLDVDLSKAPGFENAGIHRSLLMIREPGAGGPGL